MSKNREAKGLLGGYDKRTRVESSKELLKGWTMESRLDKKENKTIRESNRLGKKMG